MHILMVIILFITITVMLSIAVSTPRGLTVPVIRSAESLSMADIEKKVIEVATKARDSKLTAKILLAERLPLQTGECLVLY
jgi:2-oxoglutarate dehydrogenase E2 component (dihydrolipoamide succinyltransferase)